MSHPPASHSFSNPLERTGTQPTEVDHVQPKGRSFPRNVSPPRGPGLPSPYAGRSVTGLRPPSTVPEEYGHPVGDNAFSRDDVISSRVDVASSRESVISTKPRGNDAMSRGMGETTSAGKTLWSPSVGSGPAAKKGHNRSVSHGGVAFIRRGSNREKDPTEGGDKTSPNNLLKPAPLPSAMKKSHRRGFSHGQINPKETLIPNHMNGCGRDRSSSKADFNLTPGQEERERIKEKTASLGAYGQMGRKPSEKRGQSKTDSLGGFFKGHSRQASKTDSIYTLRTTSTNYKNKIFWWQNKDAATLERKRRTVVPNHTVPGGIVPKDPEHPNHLYLNNHVRTTKYTALSFIPKNLFEQFHRFANLYFLFIVLLNWVPAINAFGKEISMMPVIIVLIVTGIKDLYEDRRRYKSDKRVNYSTCRVYQPGEGKYVKCLWKELRVGDIVYLSNDEQIPADILLLNSSDDNGLCYIDTQNLDGETNLKQRERPRGLKQETSGTFSVPPFRCNLECDMPTTKIYRFHGSLIQPWGERIPVGKDNLLLRDCVLKNTGYIEGLVVYAGHESKAMLNNGGPRYKRSKLEKQINREVVWCVVILVVLCLIGATGNGIWNKSVLYSVSVNGPNGTLYNLTEVPPFIPVKDTKDAPDYAFQGFLTFWTFIIILQIIIPLSLYVTIEITKLCQVYLIHNDPLLYDHVHRKSVECRALNIPEELGQVQYMFCDKTGTLTENKMVFKRCLIAGKDFGHNSFSQLGTSRAIIPPNQQISDLFSEFDNPFLDSSPMSKLAKEFFMLLASCNTVIVANHNLREASNPCGNLRSSFKASSADTTMTTPAFEPSSIDTTMTTMTTLNTNNDTKTTPLSDISVDFSSRANSPSPTSTPKANHQKTHIQKHLRFRDGLSSGENNPGESPISKHKSINLPSLLNPFSKLKFPSANKEHDEDFSEEKPPEARPLYEAESPDELALVDAAFAYQCKLLKRSPTSCAISLPGEGVLEYEVLHSLPFDSVRKRMSVVLQHPITRKRTLYCKGADSAMFSCLAKPDLEGAKLIEETSKELDSYARLGLRVLVMAKKDLDDEEYWDWAEAHNKAEIALDKREKQLMDSYNRIENDMELLGATGIEDRLQEHVPETIANLRAAGILIWVLTGDKQETAINIAYSCRLFSLNMEIIKVNARSRDAAEAALKLYLDQSNNSNIPPEKRALVVDGKSLIYILDKRANLQHLFLNLTKKCGAVLACRSTPLQKAYIVRIVKEHLKMHTLAIGDGANDVSMIQTAHIGVGISGQEGMQAVMASDFAMPRFRFVERLLLVHGHWCYDRLARMVLHFFYKNATFVFVQFWYQLYCGFTGTVMIDQMYLMLFNLLFTSLPPVALGVFDRSASANVLIKCPELYSVGRLSTVYKPHSFWVNMADALYQSLVVFFVALGSYSNTDVGIWYFGTLICSQCIVVMLVQLGIETKSWTIVHWLSMLVSVLLYLAFGLSYNAACSACDGLTNPYWVMQLLLQDPNHYLVLLLSAVLSALPRVVCRVLQNVADMSEVTRTRLKQKAIRKMAADMEMSNM